MTGHVFAVLITICIVLKSLLIAENTSSAAISCRIANCEKELSFIGERIQNQEEIISTLRKDIQTHLKSTQAAYSTTFETNEAKLSKFDDTIKKVVQDIKLLKTHTNEAIESINQIKKTVVALEENQKNGREEIKDLEAAIRKLAEMLNAKKLPLSTMHKVKSGDTLDKISKEYGIPVQAIKKANKLSSNTIVVGQELEIPHK